MVKRKLLILGILIAAAATACTDPKVTNPAPVAKIISPATPLPAETQPTAYHIGIGDEIELKFFFTPELNDRLTVRPDGKISIMFAQDIQAAGLTAEQLSDLIKHKLASHIKQLDLVVVVRTFGSQKVYVGGEVAKPGPVQLMSHENVLQVVNDAGWITPAASRNQIYLIRRGTDGKDAIYPIDLRKLLSGEDMSQNVTVLAGDLLLVPPSDIIQADRWVDQYVRQMIPVTAGVYVNGGGR